ncbi:hypothetical protein V492_03545 [Pseudogymnoascus sp. VKM F-4246]|nr:hypothetical protein V492_03545 [Pseudogymnoascus sp. VKM F-4246]
MRDPGGRIPSPPDINPKRPQPPIANTIVSALCPKPSQADILCNTSLTEVIFRRAAMGICSSCLGRDRGSEEDESSGLIFDDPLSNNYGSFTDQNVVTTQADPQDVQRESEALQNIVSETSNHLVDIFATVPQSQQRPPATTYATQPPRLVSYGDLLGKSPFTNPYENISRPPTADGKQDADWLSDDEDDEISGKSPGLVKPDVGPLLGGFEDMERGAK